MRVGLQATLSDGGVDATKSVSQRQLSIAVSAIPESSGRNVPLNLCLILDHSGSMGGKPLETVKEAANRLVDRLALGDRLTLIGFDHKAKVLIPNQVIDNPASAKLQINQLKAGGGTAIDEGLRLGIEELAKGKKDSISQALLLTDGENEHGDNDRCLKLAGLATDYNLTVNTLGFGNHWNQDVLEQIADAGGGNLTYIERPEDAVGKFSELFERVQAIGLTNAHLLITCAPGVRLAELKPVAQVAPDTIELPVTQQGTQAIVRLGDLMTDIPRIVLANLYLGQMPEGDQVIAHLQVRYDDPLTGKEQILSDSLPIATHYQNGIQPQLNPQVQQHILALAKYRQTQIAEAKLKEGDRQAAATMLQTAAKTALQMGDQGAATVLQSNATRLQAGEELSEGDRKKTRIVSKTKLC
ncbi:MAG TPA: VWA domain-containing protein [Leptolyngbyaceae cyanobacterium M33_DOE_097]|uniref:VWA domain-containing protein n=1 Tax=Oscillatoriales cyanobacterium SpSt-418 TaxID=2282169 RepID=A0A7C3KHA0_9CYAN|nr:VWA domain-containing protein [Leptolyngbyaceae cyanobacterium M33_DOE_097]